MPYTKINLFKNKLHRLKIEMWKANLLKILEEIREYSLCPWDRKGFLK